MVGMQGINNFKALRKVRENFTVQKNFIDTRRLDMISLRTYVNMVQGKVTKIDRKEQIIHLNENSFLQYDLLFLMTGEQFRKPPRTYEGGENPENVFLINNAVDANKAILKLKELMMYNKDPDCKQNCTAKLSSVQIFSDIILVYGHFLQAYVTLHGLQTFGIPGSHIVFVEPFPYTLASRDNRINVAIFNDPDIDEAVRDKLICEGIEVYSSYNFLEWQFDQAMNIITSAKFEAKHNMLEVPCTAMFFFNEKGISQRLYKVMTDAGLVFDGKISCGFYHLR